MSVPTWACAQRCALRPALPSPPFAVTLGRAQVRRLGRERGPPRSSLAASVPTAPGRRTPDPGPPVLSARPAPGGRAGARGPQTRAVRARPTPLCGGGARSSGRAPAAKPGKSRLGRPPFPRARPRVPPPGSLLRQAPPPARQPRFPSGLPGPAAPTAPGAPGPEAQNPDRPEPAAASNAVPPRPPAAQDPPIPAP